MKFQERKNIVKAILKNHNKPFTLEDDEMYEIFGMSDEEFATELEKLIKFLNQ